MAPPKRAHNMPNRKQKRKMPFFKRHHGTLAVIIVLGWLVPPLAVLIRFGIGFDFFLNIILTCLGYFPGHAHNFFIQNIRNNQGRGRTPKWALKAGLIQDDTEYIKSTRQWGNRYAERNARNSYDDPNRPEEDEFGNPINPVERFIEDHGVKPAQPAGGFGPKGNDTIPHEQGGDLLSGLPDEDRETRRRNKRNQRAEYGAGLDEQDQWEAEQAARESSSYSNGRSGGGLLDDLDDPDAVAYRSRRTGSGLSNGSDGYGAGAPAPKKSGRSKKSERYGIKSDHADLGNYGTYGKSSSSGRRAQAQNDAYDIVDDRRGGSRRSTGDEDFMNHQF